MNRLSDLMYYQGTQQDNPLMGLLSEALYGNAPQSNPNGLLMLAQAPTSGGIAGGVHHEINTNPELYGPRPTAPAAPQGGGYKTGSDYVIRPPNQQQLDEFQRRAKEEAERNMRRRR